ncbi:MAG: AgmX/PglI C-terminal domain-containing protein [Alphaproteobacteria bacterium]|nr:AgmX/PglI C-terminal domain-containing protein [Alphaproteobacteria bacterium]
MTVDIGPIAYEGPDADALSATFRRYRAQWQYCYERFLNADRRLTGEVELEIVVSGGAGDTTVLSHSVEDEDFVECVRKRPDWWVFPEGVEGTLRVPIAFSLGRDAWYEPVQVIRATGH